MHRREDRAVDEEAREHGGAPRLFLRFGAVRTSRARSRRAERASRPAPAAAAGGRRAGAPASLIGAPGISLRDAVDDHLVARLQSRIDDPQVAAVDVDPVAQRRPARRARRPCRPCPCRRRRRTCPAGRPSPRPAARRSRRALGALQHHAHELAGLQRAVGVAELGAHLVRAGRRIDARVGEVDAGPCAGSVEPSASFDSTLVRRVAVRQLELAFRDARARAQLLVFGDR